MENLVEGISKESSAWIVVRFLGLLFLGKALMLLGALLLQLASIYNLLTAASIIGAHPDEQAAPQLWGPVVLLVIESAIAGSLTYYFLRRGSAIHKLLLHEASRG